MKRVFSIVLVATLLSGCGAIVSQSAVSSAVQSQQILSKQTGTEFLRQNLKVDSTIQFRMSNGVRDKATFALWVSSDGDGEGLMTYQQKLYQLAVSYNDLYIWVTDNKLVKLDDLTGHMTGTGTSLYGVDDLSPYGFVYSGYVVNSYSADLGEATVDSYYTADSSHPVSPKDTDTEEHATFSELMEFLNNGTETESLHGEDKKDDGVKSSEFVNSRLYGVLVDGWEYSIGDYCNPDDYFDGEAATGIVPKYVDTAEGQITYTYVTWSVDNKQLEVMLLDGIVKSIYCSMPFCWAGHYSTELNGQDLRYELGYNLTSKQKEEWSPKEPELTPTMMNSSESQFNSAHASFDIKYGKDKTAESIRITDTSILREEG